MWQENSTSIRQYVPHHWTCSSLFLCSHNAMYFPYKNLFYVCFLHKDWICWGQRLSFLNFFIHRANTAGAQYTFIGWINEVIKPGPDNHMAGSMDEKESIRDKRCGFSTLCLIVQLLFFSSRDAKQRLLLANFISLSLFFFCEEDWPWANICCQFSSFCLRKIVAELTSVPIFLYFVCRMLSQCGLASSGRSTPGIGTC